MQRSLPAVEQLSARSSPYEAPEHAELRIDTTELTAERAADKVVDLVRQRGLIG